MQQKSVRAVNGEMRSKSALEGFDDLPDTALVRLPVVMGLTGAAKPTVWRMAKDGRLPQPMRLGRITAWRVGDLRKALAAVSGS